MLLLSLFIFTSLGYLISVIRNDAIINKCCRKIKFKYLHCEMTLIIESSVTTMNMNNKTKIID